MEEKDKLSEYFKRQLEDYSPDPSWNVPDDHLFEAAMAQVPEESGFKRFIPGLLLLLLILVITTIGIFSFNKYQDLSSDIIALHTKIEHLDKKNKQLLDQIDVKNASIQALTDDNKRLESLVMDHNTDSETNQTPFRDHDLGIEDRGHNDNFQMNKVSVDISNSLTIDSASDNQTAILATPSDRAIYNTQKVPLLHILPVFSMDVFELKKSIFVSDNDNPTKPSWSYNIALVNNFSWLSMTDVPAQSESALTEYNKAHGCYGFKFGSEYGINNKWSIFIDLSFNRFQNRSSLKTDLFYDKAMEKGEMVEMELDIINPFGSYYSPATFRVDSDIEHNDIIEERASIRQHLTTLALSTGVNYNVFNTNKLALSVGGGIGISKTFNLKNEFDISVIHENELKVNYLDRTENVKGVKSYFFQGEFRSALAYHLTDTGSLFIEGSYQQSLTSLRDSWPASGPNTYLHALNVSTGLKFRF